MSDKEIQSDKKMISENDLLSETKAETKAEMDTISKQILELQEKSELTKSEKRRLSRCNKLLRGAVSMVNDIVLMNPEIVTAIGLLMFFATMTVRKGFLTMLLAHIMFCTPYVMLTVAPRLRSLDPNLADAALDLGCNPLQAILKVIVPQLMPGITAGALIAFTMSFDDFVISYFVTGNGVQNISIMVYTMSKRVNPSINAISTLVIVIITIALILINVLPPLWAKLNKKKEETA